MQLVKIWLAGTALLVAGAMVWSFAPILVVVIGVALGLGGLVAAIVSGARAFERRRNGGGRPEGRPPT